MDAAHSCKLLNANVLMLAGPMGHSDMNNMSGLSAIRGQKKQKKEEQKRRNMHGLGIEELDLNPKNVMIQSCAATMPSKSISPDEEWDRIRGRQLLVGVVSACFEKPCMDHFVVPWASWRSTCRYKGTEHAGDLHGQYGHAQRRLPGLPIEGLQGTRTDG